MKSQKIASLSEAALYDLYSQMGVNQSGLAIYVQAIPCPKCGTEVDPKQFFVPSPEDDEDNDPD
jgi:hypothetical protein